MLEGTALAVGLYIFLHNYLYGQASTGFLTDSLPQFQDTTLLLIDDNGLNVGQAVRDIVEERNEGFITYLWDDPVVPGDEVVCEETGPVPGTFPESEEDEEVFCEVGSPIPGRSPGTSVKRGYFILTDFGLGGNTEYVLGSGIYPKSEAGGGSGGGGGGCAIVAGSGSEPEVAAFNLFLIVCGAVYGDFGGKGA